MSTKDDWLASATNRYRQVSEEPLPKNVIGLLEDAAAQAPNEIALHFIETSTEISYGSLLEMVYKLANGFHRIGVRHSSHVAVMLPNILEMPVTWLALAAIGAVMVPVNVRYTSHELHHLLTDGEASHLVIHSTFAHLANELPEDLPLLTKIIVSNVHIGNELTWDGLVNDSKSQFTPEEVPQLDDLLNIQYTSGTTGWPKGCMLSQRYWLTCSKAYSASDGLKYRKIMSPNPFFYMTPQWLMLMAFYQRATLYVAPYLSLSRFIDWLKRYEIEFCWFPMAVLSHAPNAVASGIKLIRGNLAIHQPELHAELEERFRFRARSAFGMTEIGLGLIMPIEASEMIGSGSCGIAGPFRQARIADSEGNTVSTGTSGELLIRGPGILQGYYKRPEATAAAFHGDWFKTGDLAVQDEHGFVTIQGRLKEMIRRAGENISATEIEAALLAIPEISEAAAIPVPDAMRGEEVKVYIVLKEGLSVADIPPQNIIERCGQRLASFKIPRLIEYRSSPLPRSTSGKVSKPALINEKADLYSGSWDRATGSWI